jgi:predicted signal transduction protein with EAL and GGDEF domain
MENEELFRSEAERILSEQAPAVVVFSQSDGRRISVSYQPMSEGGWVTTFDDITERHRAEARIAHMARHDALTSLPNRVLFYERMDECLVQIQKGGHRLCSASISTTSRT